MLPCVIFFYSRYFKKNWWYFGLMMILSRFYDCYNLKQDLWVGVQLMTWKFHQGVWLDEIIDLSVITFTVIMIIFSFVIDPTSLLLILDVTSSYIVSTAADALDSSMGCDQSVILVTDWVLIRCSLYSYLFFCNTWMHWFDCIHSYFDWTSRKNLFIH